MRRAILLVGAVVLTAACGQGPTVTVKSTASSSSAPSSPSVSPSPSPAVPCAAAASYGLLITSDTLEMISPKGCVAASAAVGAPFVQFCAEGLPAVLAPPVSASNDTVYYRDGDTNIRYLTPDGKSGNATAVPGGPTKVSFFSVSPDDQRIAVLVEDLSPTSTISLKLYVEDLRGGGHHADIYSTTIPKGGGGLTLWPMGWHQGRLVLAVVLACSSSRVYHPSAWHVVDAATGTQLASIDVSSCLSRLSPSPAGVACDDPVELRLRSYDWTGTLTDHGAAPFLSLTQSLGLSPSGQEVFRDRETDWWAVSWNGGGSGMRSTVQGHVACLWINDSTILSADAVIAYPSGEVTALPASGECVGRFPGGL